MKHFASGIGYQSNNMIYEGKFGPHGMVSPLERTGD